jgi:microcystin-dependent protein
MGALADAIEQIMLAIYPLGIGHPFFGAADDVPDNFVIFDGRAISRSTYARLYAALGTTHGVGDGSLTFNVPDMRGRVPAGVDAGAGRISANNQPGQSGGAQSVALTGGQLAPHFHVVAAHTHSIPAHFHSVDLSTGIQSQQHTHSISGLSQVFNLTPGSQPYAVMQSGGTRASGAESANHTHSISGNTSTAPAATSGSAGGGNTGTSGSGDPHSNLQPYSSCIWIGWSGNVA